MSLKILNQMAWDAAFLEAREKNPGIPDWKLRKDVKAPVYSDSNNSALIDAVFAYLKLKNLNPVRTVRNEWHIRDQHRNPDPSPVKCSHVICSVGDKKYHIGVETGNEASWTPWALEQYKMKIKSEGGAFKLIHSYKEFADWIESIS